MNTFSWAARNLLAAFGKSILASGGCIPTLAPGLRPLGAFNPWSPLRKPQGTVCLWATMPLRCCGVVLPLTGGRKNFCRASGRGLTLHPHFVHLKFILVVLVTFTNTTGRQDLSERHPRALGPEFNKVTLSLPPPAFHHPRPSTFRRGWPFYAIGQGQPISTIGSC
jgi:hypothetical protein